ncbi:hypothetical protein KX729_31880 [Rhizobium sp. XQZ8]|uniref:FGGY-family carbohydrate kinase n=1 Tax=Rhizobium populisoli TaxID=2859785 RepID=UPI0028AA40E2|nr:FGGY-family carbohydrate kinase [Rhizobium populisoli]MBW6425979.1 hypothetical protein [Rhizobium populisoli]
MQNAGGRVPYPGADCQRPDDGVVLDYIAHRACGCAGQHDLVRQILADSCGKRVDATRSKEAVLRGAAMLGAVAGGAFHAVPCAMAVFQAWGSFMSPSKLTWRKFILDVTPALDLKRFKTWRGRLSRITFSHFNNEPFLPTRSSGRASVRDRGGAIDEVKLLAFPMVPYRKLLPIHDPKYRV